MTLGIILGALVGLIMGLTGAGGGILAVPLLVFGLHMTVAQAGPIVLLAVGGAAAGGTVFGLKAKAVRYRTALLVAATGVFMAPVGVWTAQRVDTSILSLLFAFVLLWVAYKTVKETANSKASFGILNANIPCVRNPDTGRFLWTTRCATALAISGSVAGLLSGLLDVGGGFVMVPALQRYTDLDMQSVVATSLAVIALISLTGVAAAITAGSIDFQVAVPFSLGALTGMLAGKAMSLRMPAEQIKKGFAAICVVVAIAMIGKVAAG